MNITAVVILYYPDETTTKRIHSYSIHVNKLIIADNSENNSETLGLMRDLSAGQSFVYIHDGENKGISMRLNQAAQLALQNGSDWLLTMDQDSSFDGNTIAAYLSCVDNNADKNETAMFGVQFSDKETVSDVCKSTEVPHLITSGSMLNLSLFNRIGSFDEALFIDKVDFEYCFRAQVKGFKIIQFNNIFFHHNLGTTTTARSFKHLQLTPRVLHSPVRMYYIVRNYFYLKSLYPFRFTESFEDMKKEILNRLKNNLLYGKQRWKLITLLRRSYVDFKAGKMGKLKDR